MNSEREHFDIKLAYEHLTGYEIKIPAFARKRATKALCPVHSETHPSCEIDLDLNKWYCFVCRQGGDVVEMVMLSGKVGSAGGRSAYRAAFEWLRSLTGQASNLKEQPGQLGKTTRTLKEIHRELIFPFLDRNGETSYDEVRLEGINFENEPDKDILLRRPLPPGSWHIESDYFVFRDPMGNPVPYGPNDPEPIRRERFTRAGTARRRPRKDYLYSLRGIERLLYRVPEVRAIAQSRGRLHMVEGAKKNDALRDRTGWTVTTIAKGANSDLEAAWLDDVAGVDELVIWSDSETVGRKSALARYNFFRPRIFKVRVVDLYFDNSHRDIFDFLKEHRDLSNDAMRAMLEERIARAALLP